MIIHTITQGETINSIAENYGKSADRLALENGISSSVNLAVGETLVILMPEILYTVQDGDTLYGIALEHNISIMELLRNNPFLSENEYIYPGDELVIKYNEEKINDISTNGYVLPFIDNITLRKTLPFLTFISIYAHYYSDTGEIISVDDDEIIRTARDFGVAPIMILVGLARSSAEEIQVIRNLLRDQELQDVFINNLIYVLNSKDYYGVNITTPYILPEDRHLYVEFIRRFSNRLKEEGYRPFLTLTLSAFELLTNVNYDDLQYDILKELVDYVTIITYEWGFLYGLPPTIVPFASLNNIVRYSSTLIDPNKLLIGYSTIGYIWRLPYIECVTVAQSVSYDSAIDLAREFNAEIHFDDITRSSFFQYYSNAEHIARLRDVRGIDSILDLVQNYKVGGISIWNVMYFCNQMWLVINSQYQIKKIIPVNLLE